MKSVLTLSVALWLGASSGAAAQRPTTAQTPAARPGSIEMTVSSGLGPRIAAAVVTTEGAVSRRGTTGADGVIMFQNVPPGTYRCRIERDGFITLEKEIVVRTAARTAAEAVLTVAPPPPPPPAPPPSKPTGAMLLPGEPKAIELTALADPIVRDPAPIAERALGCSGATAARLIRLMREPLTAHTHAEADEMLYVIAGEATLKLGEKDHVISPGWLGIVPRGMSHTLTRQGRTAVLVLSVISGPPCPTATGG